MSDSVFPQPLLQWVEKHGEKEFHWVNEGGLTKREMFSGLMLQAFFGQNAMQLMREMSAENSRSGFDNACKVAIGLADVLIAELAKAPESKL